MSSVQDWLAVPRMRAALLVLVLALALLVWSAVRALGAHEVMATPATVQVTPGALDAPTDPVPVNVAAAVAQGLFSQDRVAPEARYRMPGEAVAKAAAPKPPDPIVLGTALAADGASFATVQLPSGRLQQVHVGEKVGEFIVKSIERGKVVFTTPDGKPLEILAFKSGS